MQTTRSLSSPFTWNFHIVDNSEVKTHVFRTSLSRFENVNDFFGKIDDSEISIVLSF